MQERGYWRKQTIQGAEEKVQKRPPNTIKQKLAKQTKSIICEMREWKIRKDSKRINLDLTCI